MSNKTELFGSYVIHDGDDRYTLEANIDFEKGNSFYMPSFTFLNVKSIVYLEQNLCWDNDEYLLLMHSALKKYEDFGKFTTEEIDILKDLSKTIDDLREDFSIILEMLEKGIEIGMFNDALKLKNETETRKD